MGVDDTGWIGTTHGGNTGGAHLNDYVCNLLDYGSRSRLRPLGECEGVVFQVYSNESIVGQ